MQVRGVELADLLQSLPVQDGQTRSLKPDQPAGSEFLESAVNVHGRDAHRITKLGLGHWKLALLAVAQPHCPHSDHELAHDVSERVEGLTSPDVNDPLAKDRSVDQRLPPEGAGNPVVPFADFVDGLVT